MERRVAVRAIIVSDGKLLCAQAKPYTPNVVTNRWGVPGGGVDAGEPLVPALEREIYEELGVKPKVGNLLYIQQFYNEIGREVLELFFRVTNTEDFLNIDLSTTSHGKHEIARLELIDPSSTEVVPTFLMTESYDSLENQPTKLFNYL